MLQKPIDQGEFRINPYISTDTTVHILEQLSAHKLRSLETIAEIGELDIENVPKELIALLFHPYRQIMRKSLLLLKKHFPESFNLISPRNITSRIMDFSTDWQKWGKQYLLHLLTTKSTDLYKATLEVIFKNPSYYRSELIEGLVSSNDALARNCVQLLHEFFPSEFSSENIPMILGSISEPLKEHLLNILKKRLQFQNLPWHIRDSIIRLLGALQYASATDSMLMFLSDPDKNVRYTLASSLIYDSSPPAVEALFTLLLDTETLVRFKAAESLGVLFPSQYKGKHSTQILSQFAAIHPLDFLKLMTPERMDAQIIRIWDRLQYDGHLIKNMLNISNNTLLDDYLGFLKKGSGDSQERSIFLLIQSRMPDIRHQIENLFEIESNPVQQNYLQKVLNRLEKQYQIVKKEGFFFLL